MAGWKSIHERRREDTAQPERKKPNDLQTRPHGPIVPSANVQGSALLAVIAIMSFLACLTLGGVSMVRATAASWQSQISREITIQIKPDDNLDMDKALTDAQPRILLRRRHRRNRHGQAGNLAPARTMARRQPEHRRIPGSPVS